MTPSELKNNVEKTGSYFFDRLNMRFFCDTMANYGCRSFKGCWELWRKTPVNGNCRTLLIFAKKRLNKYLI